MIALLEFFTQREMQRKLTNINTRVSNKFLVITIYFPSLYGDNVI